MPKSGLEPKLISYKETVLPIKLFRLKKFFSLGIIVQKFFPSDFLGLVTLM